MDEHENDEQVSEAPSSVTMPGDHEEESNREQSVETQIESDHDDEGDSEESDRYEEDEEDNHSERTMENEEEEGDRNDHEDDVRDVVTPQPQPERSSFPYETRTKGRRSAASFAKYDQKYHPMDVHTRPTLAAKRPWIGGHSTASTPRRGSASDEDSVVLVDSLSPNGERSVDGLRRSSRSESKKPTNYSNKHHPQDYGIPGFQHRASQVASFRSVAAQASPAPARKRRRGVIQDSESPEVDDADEIEVLPSKPAKKLRQLDDEDLPKTKKGKKTKKVVQSSDVDNIVNETLLKIGVDPTQPIPTARPSPPKAHQPESWDEEVERLVEDTLSKSVPSSHPQHKAAKRRGTSPSKAIPISSDAASSDGPTDADLDLNGNLDQEMQQTHDSNERPIDISATTAGMAAISPRTLAAGSERHIPTADHAGENEPPSEFDEQFAITQMPMPSSNNEDAFPRPLHEAATTGDASHGKDAGSEARQSLIPPNHVPSDDDPPSSGPVDSSMNTKFSFEDDEDDHFVGLDDVQIEQPAVVEIHLAQPPREEDGIQDHGEVGPHELWTQMDSTGSRGIEAK